MGPGKPGADTAGGPPRRAAGPPGEGGGGASGRPDRPALLWHAPPVVARTTLPARAPPRIHPRVESRPVPRRGHEGVV